ncbi:MAG: hypothetical protein N3E45_09215 [Oscillatoriaceae bacterium SKW80]|nr:hypothetical protein [Oscillatoriaceae bacterium SKYG93]MCX8120993.1 hypothetical protein [Oscillatoriaceae bacterium SKW80]MDW8452266.1 hypothetical protein [Oscillatoriaceae cyanobacterium SKYGB_i_bin93]HIK26601.1 hypothetical protein [Oscillatoriaceae cyanobacterium M7585_C2015_266]
MYPPTNWTSFRNIGFITPYHQDILPLRHLLVVGALRHNQYMRSLPTVVWLFHQETGYLVMHIVNQALDTPPHLRLGGRGVSLPTQEIQFYSTLYYLLRTTEDILRDMTIFEV